MRKMLSVFSLALLTLIILLFISVRFFRFTPSSPVIHLDKGWTVTYHNQQYLNTNLESMSAQVGGFFSRGDMITLNQTQILVDMHVPFPYLFFKTQFCDSPPVSGIAVCIGCQVERSVDQGDLFAASLV